jgi:2-C-methyl-D-erythritol 4-phosphate cytidylyltransferase
VNKIALIVAGGTGTRMKSAIPKQFLLIRGYPLLMYTVNIFYRYDKDIRIIIVLPENQIDEWKKLCSKYAFVIEHDIRQGGETRFHSVQKNLADIPDQSLVAIHDGVRPLVSIPTITRCFDAAQEFGNAIPCVEIPETLRRIDHKGNQWVNRTQYRLIQTPQVFMGSIIKKAYLQEYQSQFTDDAGVVESLGHNIHLVEGNPENIKITIEKDLIMAASLLK